MQNKYKYTLSEDLTLNVYALKGIEVNEKWLKVRDCVAFIPKTYSWDGCTFAPDFKSTYHASLVHDVLYQYKINRKLADKVFYNILKEYDFKAAKLYYLGTRIFGNLFY